MSGQRSSAGPLAAAFALLVVYASLYPFAGWRWPPGQDLTGLLALPWPPWRDRFDEAANLAGYAPLGALLYGAVVRSGGGRGAGWALGLVAPAGLSFAMESIQNFLPQRVPSAKDLALNAAGAALGVLLAAALHGLGAVDRWQLMRERWFVRQSAGALVLLLLWPLGLLFPTPLPLGLGQVGDVLREAIEAAFEGTRWADGLAPFFAFDPGAETSPTPAHELAVVVLGLLAPCLVAFSVTRRGWRRAVLALGAAALALATTTLSTALNFGPDHALTWLTPFTLGALGAGLLLAALCSFAGRRAAAGIGLIVLGMLATLVAQVPSDPYYAASLQLWEQGRFIRFHGLARWVGWLWPYLAMAWLLARVAARDDEPRA